MKLKTLLILLALFESAFGQTMPIRGATGGGYGRFSWGASLETVESLIKNLKKVESSDSQEEKDALRIIKKVKKRSTKASRSSNLASRQPRLSAYRYWIKFNQLPGRVDLSFFDQRLYQAVVGIAHKPQDKATIDDIFDIIVEKYGLPLGTPDRAANIDRDNILKFSHSTGSLVIERTSASLKDTGYIRLEYRSSEIQPKVLTYLNELMAHKNSLLKSILRSKKRKNSRKTQREVQIDKMRTHL